MTMVHSHCDHKLFCWLHATLPILLFQEMWSSDNMHDSWKVGVIKLLMEVASPSPFGY
mgnify:CR=1 FL=1